MMSLFVDNGRKLFVTFHIRNVTKTDDSQDGRLGRYECHAYAVGVNSPAKYGFSINVIESKYNSSHVDTSVNSFLKKDKPCYTDRAS